MAGTSLIGLGISGLNASQLALSTTGHNVTNASTPGFSRQRVTLTSQEGATGINSGNGVRAVDVSRTTDQLLSKQIRTDTSSAGDVRSFLDGAGQLDNLLANETTGLAPGLGAFFGAVAAASAEPTSIPARRLVLTQAQGLATRFHALYDRLEEQTTTATGQLSVSAAHVTALAQGIAEVNGAITRAGSSTQLPNDLLDKRDELLRQLAEEVQTNVVTQRDGQLSVFVGNGVGLVVGSTARSLLVTDGGNSLALRGGGPDTRLDDTVGGGRIGGLQRLRHAVLETAFNSLGRIAHVVSQTVNNQLRQGIDLAGNAGAALFAGINTVPAVAARVTRVSGDGKADLSVVIDNASAITASDYDLSFSGPSNNDFQIQRKSDSAIVYRGNVSGVFPQTAAFDGLRLTFAAGTFTTGDRFMLQPTRHGAREIDTVLSAPESLALASPLRTAAAYGNRGTGRVDGADVLDITQSAFARAGTLTPPLLVRFTSPTTYDVLDGTDPLRPVPLTPPLTGLPFVAGVANALLPADPGERIALSDGAKAGRLASAPVILTTAQIAAGVVPGNGYLAEALTFAITDPLTGRVTTAAVTTSAASSAAAVANSINGVRGVSARATSSVTLSNATLSASSNATVVIDGEAFAGAALANLGTLADSINARAALQGAGISARSDGTQLVLTDARGADLTILLKGAAGDGLQLRDEAGSTLLLQGAGPGSAATIAGNIDRSAGYDFSTGGPYDLALSVDNGPTVLLTPTGTYGDGAQLVLGLQAQLDASAIGPGKVTVSIDGAGYVSLTGTSAGEGASLAVAGVPAGSPLALALGIVDSAATGADTYQGTTIGGQLAVALGSGVQLSATPAAPGGSLFSAAPQARSAFLGYQVRLSGAPATGDQFGVTYNSNGSSDNRNALALATLQTEPLIGSGQATFADGYAELVQYVGSKTSAARVDADAADSVVQQSTALRDGLAGVNLDEEAANLLRFQQAYTASARVVSTARELFNSLLGIFN